MQFLILSDLHANWPALKAVIDDTAGQYEAIVCCGDVVGYNPQPGRVLEWVRACCNAVIRGNHDKVVAGIDDIEWFNEVAQTAARWTMDVLSEDQLAYLRSLQQGPASIDGFQIWHGSPVDEDEYLTAPGEAARCFSEMHGPLGFFGHTHLQGGFFAKHGYVGILPQVRFSEREYVLELEPDVTYMVNPGSVGQPRDRDPRAAYVLFDSSRKLVTFRRVPYSVAETVADIQAAGLPDMLGLRLLAGF
ncbi:MAG TPA: metallophosphoesterase family protein [Bryobacteraceae bacterium]|nr:metallophosphoesterase family protein [Bryobacteraceae bacterium]